MQPILQNLCPWSCSESLKEVIEAGIDEMDDALQVRIDFNNVTRNHFLQVFLGCSESPQEVTEAGIDEMDDDLEVRSDFDGNVTQTDHFFRFSWVATVSSRPPSTYWGRFSQSE